jgi:DNA polymerase-3 subunit alpha/error-prone DNA polymerase
MIYQEDVMKVVQALAGFSLGEADSLRRAMSGKSRGPDEMIKTRDAFLSAAQARGHDPQFIAETWRQIESFCGYAFCKAHSASYAVLSLQLLWFKEYHPAHFFAGVLNNRGGFYSPQAYIFEARRAGLTVLPPDLDHSRLECLGQGNFIRLGFSFIVDLRQETTRRILQEREITPFTDFPDFLSRVRPATNEIDQLIDSGTLNRFGTPAGLRWQSRLLPSPGLFATETPVPAFAGKALTDPEKARLEARSLGVVLCRHPLEFFKLHTHTVFSDQLAEKSGKTVLLNGILIAGKSVRTKRGERMKFLTFDDGHGTFDVTFFPKTWRKLGHWFTDGIAFQIIGEVENTWGMPTITAKNALPLVESF